MNHIELFLKQIENYYGEYKNPVVKECVSVFLEDFQESKIMVLLKIVMVNHRVSFGTPDMACINDAHNAYMKESGNSLKNIKENQQWVDMGPLTEKEKSTAKESHDNFLSTMTDLKLMKNQPDQKPSCMKCQFKPMDGSFLLGGFECKGCIDFSKFKSKI